MMQEEIEQKSVALITRGATITARILAKAMVSAQRRMRRARDNAEKKSAGELASEGSYHNIEISDANIKEFEPVARKYGIQYKLAKDDSMNPPRWLVFFKAKDTDAMTAAFKEFAQETLKRKVEKPSVRETMAQAKEAMKHVTRDKVKHKERSGPEL
jgi:hypothetical protein